MKQEFKIIIPDESLSQYDCITTESMMRDIQRFITKTFYFPDELNKAKKENFPVKTWKEIRVTLSIMDE